MIADTANLLVKMSLGGNFQSQIGKATKGVQKFDREASRAFKAGGQIGTGIKRAAALAAVGVGVLVTQIGFGLDQLIQLESLTAQTNAALKSTGNTAGQTADSIRNLAEKYEGLNATVDDKVIQSGENLLLTFTAINKKAFEPALATSLDLSTALGTDLNSAIKIVGKALSDPAKAAGKLTRAGIILTKSEQKQIAAHLKNNDTLGAQGVVLAALNKRYGGSFLAGGNTTAGKVAKFGDAIEDLQKTLATALLPAIGHIADGLNELFRDPATIAAAERIGKKIGELFSPKNIKDGIATLKSGFSALKAIAGPIADVVGAAVKAFASLPPEIKTLLVGGFAVNKLTGGLVTNIFGGIAEAIAKSFIKAPLVNVQGAVVNVNGAAGVPGVPGGPGGATPGGKVGLLGNLAKIIGVGVLAEVATDVGPQLNTFGTDLRRQVVGENFPKIDATDLEWPFGPKNTPTILPDIFGGNGFLGGKAGPTALRPAAKAPSSGLHDEQVFRNTPKKVDGVTAAVKAHMARESRSIADVKAQAQRTAAAVKDADSSVHAVKAQTAASGASITGAIRANRPIVTTNVNVSVSGNSVNKVIQVTGRYGQPAGSRNQNNIGVSGAR